MKFGDFMKTANKIIAILIAFVLLFSSAFSLTAYAEELRYFERGILTDGTYTAYYVIDKDNKVLYITGDGNNLAYTPDYPDADSGPFAGRTDITRIVIEEDVARVGDYALSNMTKVDTLEVQSNLLSSSSSMSSKAMIGCTGLRHIQGDSALLSTDVFLDVVKGALNIASGNWLSLIANGVSIISTGVNGDDSLDNDTVHCMVDDYINNGNKIFLGDLDEAKEEYNERLANPCYSNNAFHHDYTSEVTTQPTCTADGVETYTCSVCNDTYTVSVDALGHDFTDSVLYQPSCFTEGITKHYCTRCGLATYDAIAAFGHHTYDLLDYDEVSDKYTKVCSVCNDRNTQFDNDTSALISAVSFAKGLDEDDYLNDSYSPLPTAIERYVDLDENDYLQYPQEKIDEKTAEILTVISELVPEVQLHLISTVGGTLEAECETVKASAGGKEGLYHLAVGTQVSLTAVSYDGSSFYGWYDTTDRRFISTEETFVYTVGSDTTLKAVFRPAGYARLAFVTSEDNQQYYAQYIKSTDYWDGVASIENMLPDVPHNYGYNDYAWTFDEDEVLASLRSGNDVTIYSSNEAGNPSAEYDSTGAPDVPVLTLSKGNDTNIDGTDVNYLVMNTSKLKAEKVQEIGLLLYYRKKDTGFDPSSVTVALNKKNLSSIYEKLNNDNEYVTSLSYKFNEYNIAVRGYVNYYGENGKIYTYYSNQINITDGNRFAE